jgi:hypothetical protein
MRLVTNPKINLAMLAKNLGTSVEMLMRHYCSHIHVHEHADIFVNDPRGIGAHSFQFDPRLPMVAAGEMTLRSASMLAEWDNMAGLS